MWRLLYAALLLRVAAAQEARFVSGDAMHEASVGSDSTLECQVADADQVSVMWERPKADGTPEMLTIEDYVMASDRLYTLVVTSTLKHKTFALTIPKVEAIDSGDYFCTLATDPPKRQRHHLRVNTAPRARIGYASSIYVARRGDNINLPCVASGNPLPNVKWLKGDDTVSTDRTLVIANAEESDTGVYTCLAYSATGNDSQSITIKVHSAVDSAQVKPSVRTKYDYVPVLEQQQSSVNISCLYRGNPEPTIKWTKAGFQIYPLDNPNKYKEYNERTTNETIGTLEVLNFGADDIGDYACIVGNSMGGAQASVHVDSKPGPSTIEIIPDGSDRVRISVKVTSPTEITEWEIKYWEGDAKEPRVRKHKLTKQARSVTRAPNADQVWTGELQLDNLKPETDYRVEVRAENAQGWGAYSRQLIKYRTPGKRSSHTPSESVVSGGSSTQHCVLLSAFLLVTAYVLKR